MEKLDMTLKSKPMVIIHEISRADRNKSSQVNFRLMAEYNISVSRLTELHSRFTSNKVNRMSNGKIKVKHWSFIAYADVLATDKIVN